MKKKTFLLFGAQGMLGAEIFHSSLSKDDIEIIPFSRFNADITNLEHIEVALSQFSLDGVINATGFTAVDRCEDERWAEQAYNANVLGPKYLAESCQKRGLPLYHFSTDYVFSGKVNESFSENDTPNPINAYGKTKAEGEAYVLKYAKGYVLRTAWLSGEYGPNFVHQIVHFLKTRPQVLVVEEYGSPSFCHDVSNALFDILMQPLSSQKIFHLVNEGSVSRKELVEEIQLFLKIKTPISLVEDFGLLAQRPVSSVLKNTYLSALPDWKSSLHIFLTPELQKLEKKRITEAKKKGVYKNVNTDAK